MMANARSEQLAFAKGEYAKKHPHTAAPKKKPSLDQFLNQQMSFRASFEAWAAFQEDRSSSQDVLNTICGSSKSVFRRLKGE